MAATARALALLLAAPLALVARAAPAECAGELCYADAEEDSASLLAHRAAHRHRSGDRRRRKCVVETGSYSTMEPDVSAGFSTVDVAGDFEVKLTTGGGPSVLVRAVDSGIKEYVDISAAGGVLTIKFKEGMPCTSELDQAPIVQVTSPTLPTTIRASADAEVGSQMAARVDSLSLTATSDADIQIENAQATSMHITVSSSGTVELEDSSSSTMTVSASSSGQVEEGTTSTLHIEASSSAEVELRVTGSASGSVTSSATLEVSGGGDVSGVSTSSGGRVKIDD